MGRPSVAVVPSRAGLVGHPSDGFGGAVLSTPVPEVAATVTVSATDDGCRVGGRRFDDLDALVAASHRELLAPLVGALDGEALPADASPGGVVALLAGAVAELVTWLRALGSEPPAGGIDVAATTTVPRSVGLAGSSAFAIGALRALAAHWDVDVPDEVGPRLALAAEVERLGIAAGPQDRLVQWHATPLLMELGPPAWPRRAVHPPSPVELLVCWTTTEPTPSHATHAPLRARGDEPEVRRCMAELAELARHGADALAAGDLGALGRCMDDGFEHRRALVPLDPAHVAMVDGLRALGAHATYTGSGGAVVALTPDPAALEPLRRWAVAEGLGTLTTTVA